jgi:hypothetical protein
MLLTLRKLKNNFEDNQMMADSVAELLKKCGKETDVYYDAHVFLEKFAKYSKNTCAVE